jgi:cytosine/adenosine deaminase-related metal-dependent hydrolase
MSRVIGTGNDLVINAGQLIRGPEGDRVTDAAVWVRGATIAAAGPAAEVEAVAPPPAVRRDYPRSTVLPGLINGHVHLAMDGGPDPVRTMLDSDPDL